MASITIGAGVALGRVRGTTALNDRLTRLASRDRILFAALGCIRRISSTIHSMTCTGSLVRHRRCVLGHYGHLTGSKRGLDTGGVESLSGYLSDLLAAGSSLISLLGSSLAAHFGVGSSRELRSLVKMGRRRLGVMRGLGGISLVLSASRSAGRLVRLGFLGW